MAKEKNKIAARTFYLNEQHELSHGERDIKGGHQKLGNINWIQKGRNISHSLISIKERVKKSKDPLKEQRYFILARPQEGVPKLSVDIKKAPEGHFLEVTSYQKDHSLVFKKLGMDLIQVNDDGTATVHARPERFEQITSTVEHLNNAGVMEQSRWATIENFDLIPPRFRIDLPWLERLQPTKPTDSVIELQPFLTITEKDSVIRSIAAVLNREKSEALTGSGTDFSGRLWLRGRLTPESLNAIAQTYYSVQSLHSPLISLAAVVSTRKSHSGPSSTPIRHQQTIELQSLPCIGVLDTGVPPDHLLLSKFKRGQYIEPNSGAGRAVGDHGSLVTSRVVFGHLPSEDGTPPSVPQGECSFYDIIVANGPDSIEEKSILPALQAVVGNAPDVRVFNISFDNLRALELESEIRRREKLILLQDLDNFIFANDVLVVVAAGNSPRGVVPSIPYPGHIDQDEWKLGTWSRCFNAITCGSFIDGLNAQGLVTEPGAPSAFTRIGPGIADSPKPDFSEPGGNSDASYHLAPGLGVWACNASAQWEDHCGTSFAAPLLSRAAALALRDLQKVCESGTKPFAVTAKAYLALTAIPHKVSSNLIKLAQRTLGRGQADIEQLKHASADSAVMVWQGIIESPIDIVRIQIPVPKEWLDRAKQPRLHLIVSWDSPVNAAVHQVWASRKVNVQLRTKADTRALRGHASQQGTYPLIDRTYDLKNLPDNVKPTDDMWLLEISYAIAADHYPAIDFSPQQRVGFAAKLFDDDEDALSPQPAMQALPIAETMQKLSVSTVPVRNLVAIKSRAS